MVGVMAMACSALAAVSSDGGSTREVHLHESFAVVGDVIECRFESQVNDALLDIRLFDVEAHTGHKSLSAAELVGMLRRRVPGLDRFDASDFAEEILFVSSMREPEAEIEGRNDCSELNAASPLGAPIFNNDVSAVPCQSDKLRAALAYDRGSGLVRAAADLSAGEYLGQLRLPDPHFADSGDTLDLQISIGPVVIKREVRALQPVSGREGRSFVADAEGDVLLVPTQQLNVPQEDY